MPCGSKDSGYSRFKVIVSGNVFEVYRYQVPVRYGERSQAPPGVDEFELSTPLEADDEVTRSAANIRRARNDLRRLILTNFKSEHSKFVTLTYAENMTDPVQGSKDFDRFMKRLRRRYGDFKYSCVIEFQERGAVHYHLILDAPYIPANELRSLWTHGFVKINRIKHVDNVGAYVTAYMTKDMMDPRLNGRKAYTVSQNCEKPYIARGRDAIELIEAYCLDQVDPVYSSSYPGSEYTGEIFYDEFNLKRHLTPGNWV